MHPFNCRRQSKKIGIVADPFTIFAPNDRVDCAHFASTVCQLIAKGNDILLVRYGDIDCGKIPIFQKIADLIRLFFEKVIGISTQMAVDLGGVAMTQLTA
jgi:hypothetical protein